MNYPSSVSFPSSFTGGRNEPSSTLLVLQLMAGEHKAWAHEWLIIALVVTAAEVVVVLWIGVPVLISAISAAVLWSSSIVLRSRHLRAAEAMSELGNQLRKLHQTDSGISSVSGLPAGQS